MLALVEQLSYAGNEAARRYLNGEIDAAAAAAWLERYAMTPRRAPSSACGSSTSTAATSSTTTSARTWSAPTSSGAPAAAPSRARWREFARLLSSPRLPSGLK